MIMSFERIFTSLSLLFVVENVQIMSFERIFFSLSLLFVAEQLWILSFEWTFEHERHDPGHRA